MFLLFDVDNTLTIARGKITPLMKEMLRDVKNSGYTLGVVSGSDLIKLKEQLEDSISHFDWLFTENGLVTYSKVDGKHEIYSSTNLVNYVGEHYYQDIVNECLSLLSEVRLPLKRGVFLELRTGLLNVCPVGRSCTQEERCAFEEYDNEFKVREHIRDKLLSKFGNEIECSIGGQISLDLFPKGWNKTYCLQFIEDKEILFFGDRIFQGGNDYEIGTSDRVKPYKVKNWKDTYDLLKMIMLFKY